MKISDEIINKAFHAYQGAPYTGSASWPGISAAIAAVAPLIAAAAFAEEEAKRKKVYPMITVNMETGMIVERNGVPCTPEPRDELK